ncbi:MAG: phage major capsid protein [Bacteroidia bacterium]|nr:phage major capsid protein [Bacteroidia bacterium]
MDVISMLKKMAGVEVKTNEVMNTGNTGYGAEFVPSEVFVKEVIDLMPKYSNLLSLLPGNHGTGLPKKYTAAAKGLSIGDTMFQGKGQWTTGTGSQTEDDHGQSRVSTKQVSLEQVSFICEVDISDEQLRYNAANTEEYVKSEIARGMALTVDGLIINGDAETGATGNVNSDDQAPATTYAANGGAKYYALMIDHGIRERAINGSYTKDFGTLADTDYMDLLGVLGRYATIPGECLFIQPIQVTNKMKTLDAFKLIANSGDRATIQSGIVPTPYGTDVLTHHLVPLTEADGKVSKTAGSNTKGQTLALYKPAVQYGFGQDFKLEVVRVAGYGYRLVATFDFAFTIVDSEASLANPTVAAGINITL